MGGGFSMSCDQTLNQVSKWLCLKGGYIHNLSDNLVSLEKAMGVLKAKRDDVQGRVHREEFTAHRQRLAQVQVWLTSILDIENQYNDLLSTSKLELERLCICGFCSKNLKLSYRYGERVILVVRDVESLISQGEFDVVTEATPIPEVEELPTHPTIVGQETTLERVWNRLTKDTVGIVGLHGMGGVGKTTLLTQINNKFSKTGEGFDVVVWVEVSRNASVRKIQESIAKKLGLVGKEWDEKNEKERALDIHNVLRRKKFVLLLDDIWEKVNLYAVGVPYPSTENGCKVVFTTRSHDVCGRMGVNDPIEVTCLDSEKAWDLFRKKVGENTLESHSDIPKLARQVAEKCRGLPLALNVIGETMAYKSTIQEWHLALDVLTSSAQEFSGMEDEILPILKYSYDNLKGEQAKSCFLYCSLLYHRFEKERLIEYWICEGFIDEKEGREMALKLGYAILGTLVRASLLEEDELTSSYLKIHDVVRDMGLWIASDLGKHKERCIGQDDIGLREMPKVKNWKDVRKMSLMGTSIEKISESPDCLELTTLLLGWNTRLTTISGDFFWSMPRLLVLDLSWCGYLNGLPEQISRLSSLRCLDLARTQIDRLPVGFQELKMLIHLNLEFTKVVSCDGISNLSRLRTLKLVGSEVWLDMSLMKELQLLEHLEFVSINIFSSLVGKLLLYDPRIGRCIQHIHTEDRPEEESLQVFVLPAMDTLRRFYIWNCGGREIEVVEKTPLNKSPTSPPCFSNLSRVQIGECDGLKDLTWLLFAPNLTSLYVLQSKQLEEIISKDKGASVLEKKDTLVPFKNLEDLHLSDLPELKSIFWSALPFQRLKDFLVVKCMKLRKLPLDSKSILKVEEFEFRCKEEEWMQGVEWEDEATRNRFLPSFNLLPNH